MSLRFFSLSFRRLFIIYIRKWKYSFYWWYWS